MIVANQANTIFPYPSFLNAPEKEERAKVIKNGKSTGELANRRNLGGCGSNSPDTLHG